MKKIYLFITFLVLRSTLFAQSPICDPLTPFRKVDLNNAPDSLWVSDQIRRNGLCCGLDPLAKPPIRCVQFELTLDTGAMGLYSLYHLELFRLEL